jgi:peptide/nickel transport system substrate-binding protein
MLAVAAGMLVSGGCGQPAAPVSSPAIATPGPGEVGAGAGVGPADLVSYRRLPAYAEPAWVTRDFVRKGKLPPVERRLPREPLVYGPAAMPDGPGTYGDALRQVTGGRPEGWNYSAGQSQGWGGIDLATMECLTRTGPLFLVDPARLEPLPNLAKSWRWSADGRQLTMQLIEGAKWSDGHPFSSADVMFYWNDNVLDPNVSPLNGASPDSFGPGTRLEALGPYTIRWTFRRPFPRDYLYQMAYGKFCPGPAHVLRPHHPRYNPRSSYQAYKLAFPASRVNFPVMGAWVVTEYRPDDILILRRNPYYWKVDARGRQLPYLDEVQYRLLSWGDREVQAIAGGSDMANIEGPASFVEVLRSAARPQASFRAIFGPRTIAYSVHFNLSGNGWGEPDARGRAVRRLNRTTRFRQAVSMAIDRVRLGETQTRGPFIHPYPGGLLESAPLYDARDTIEYPHDPATARALLASIGLVDRDGDGFVNYPRDTQDGANVTIVLTASPDSVIERSFAEGIQMFARDAGLRVVLRFASGPQRDALRASGQFDWVLQRNETTELNTVVQGADALAPTGPYTHAFHRAGPDGRLDLLPHERQLVALVRAFIASPDAAERRRLMRLYQRVSTANVNALGLIQYSGGVLIDKRFANVPAGTPVIMFNWAEDAIMRERLWVPRARRSRYELRPGTLPGCFDCGGARR